MDAAAILDRLNSLGVKVTQVDGTLRFEPGSAVPSELVPEIKEHKQELMRIIKSYRLKYSESEITDKELAEIEARVYQDGCVLLWSTVLNDTIAFYRDDKSKIPPGFVPYSLEELNELFGGGVKIRHERLRFIHEAKKMGAVMTTDKDVNPRKEALP